MLKISRFCHSGSFAFISFKSFSSLNLSHLTAISPIDGRYSKMTESLREFFSEYSLIKNRVKTEIKWFQFLSNILPELKSQTIEATSEMNNIIENFSLSDAKRVKEIESIVKHDLKAVEYFLKEKFAMNKSLAKLSLEFLHFGATSEDINNISYGLMLNDMRSNIISPTLKDVTSKLSDFAIKYASFPMVGRTHGQIATPTTIGKEFANFAYRLSKQLISFDKVKILGKINGAVGNFAAMQFAYPEIDWKDASSKFVLSLGLHFNPYTTQIEPHDYIAELCDSLSRCNTVLIDFDRDIWGYISFGVFKQNIVKDEVGSSTMPHKVNPIDFENSEGNLGISNSLLNFFSNKLPISRFQRDLSDSTVLRNLGIAFAYGLIAYKSTILGLSKLIVNQEYINKELDKSWEVLAEPIQTIMRKYELKNPYEQLKIFTRGQKIDKVHIEEFVDSLNLSSEQISYIKSLTPFKYIGLSKEQALSILKEINKLD